MPGRRSRGKPPPPLPARAELPPEEVTMPVEVTPELLESMGDESERPTLRLPARPAFANPEDELIAQREGLAAATVRQRVMVGPDGVARILDEEELEETTRPHVPSKMLLAEGKSRKKKR
jgi:hypothetical protein